MECIMDLANHLWSLITFNFFRHTNYFFFTVYRNLQVSLIITYVTVQNKANFSEAERSVSFQIFRQYASRLLYGCTPSYCNTFGVKNRQAMILLWYTKICLMAC